jgi:hypothetical protein
MAKEKYIPIDIYKRCIHVFIGSLDDFKDWVENYYNDDSERDFVKMVLDLEEEKIGMASFSFDWVNGTGVVLIPDYPHTPKEYAALVHEMMHATFFIMNYCRCEYSYEGNNEPYTYLIEYLMRSALESEGYKEIKQKTQ